MGRRYFKPYTLSIPEWVKVQSVARHWRGVSPTFVSPAIVKKCQKDIGGIKVLILSMYAKGMSTRDIQHHV